MFIYVVKPCSKYINQISILLYGIIFHIEIVLFLGPPNWSLSPTLQSPRSFRQVGPVLAILVPWGGGGGRSPNHGFTELSSLCYMVHHSIVPTIDCCLHCLGRPEAREWAWALWIQHHSGVGQGKTTRLKHGRNYDFFRHFFCHIAAKSWLLSVK